MPGGWTMTMVWMRMPGQTWPGAALAFVEMWAVMMAVMMLPAFISMLRPYRDDVAGPGAPLTWRLLALVAAGYFVVWTLVGAALFPLGAAFAAVAMYQPAFARGLDGLWGMYQWLDRAPMGRNEQGVWWRRHDEYGERRAAS